MKCQCKDRQCDNFKIWHELVFIKQCNRYIYLDKGVLRIDTIQNENLTKKIATSVNKQIN